MNLDEPDRKVRGCHGCSQAMPSSGGRTHGGQDGPVMCRATQRRARGGRDQPDVGGRYRERHPTSGAKSDTADFPLLAEIVRLDRAHHRPVAGDSDAGVAIKLTARTHQRLVWDRRSTRRRAEAATIVCERTI